jgi:hypothetical protein
MIRLVSVLTLVFAAATAEAGSPRCFLHGIITPIYENKDKSSLSDMIRMHFEAADKAKCEQMMSAYCQYHVKDKGYSPTRLKASYKPDTDKSEEFTFSLSEGCKLSEN